MTSFEEAAALCADVTSRLGTIAGLVERESLCVGLLMVEQEEVHQQLLDAGFTDPYAMSVAQGLGWAGIEGVASH